MLIGARLSFDQIAADRDPGRPIIVVTMAGALAPRARTPRLASVEPRLAVLLAVGAAVCGNSAVVATAPVIGARRDVAFAVADGDRVRDGAAVFVYPLVRARVSGRGTSPFGLWTGYRGQRHQPGRRRELGLFAQALDVATVVKLIRNVLMAPLLVGIAWAWVRTTASSVGDTSAGLRKAVPLFVLGFLAMTALRSLGIIGPDLAAILDPARAVHPHRACRRRTVGHPRRRAAPYRAAGLRRSGSARP